MTEAKEGKEASIVAAIQAGNIDFVRSSLESGEFQLHVSVSVYL
jgi:hypothetical protein